MADGSKSDHHKTHPRRCIERAGRSALPHAAMGLALLATVFAATAAQAQPRPVVGPQIRIDVVGGTAAANETTISVSAANPLEIVASWNDWRRSTSSELINTGVGLSLDGGQSWTDFLVRPPLANQSSVEGDPFTAFDRRTGTLWVGGISFSAGFNSGIYVARKDAGAPAFEPAVMARTASGTDKPWMVAGPRPGMPDTTRLYITYNEGVIWSDDMGQTWTSPTSLGGGIGYLPRLGSGGELYVAYWDFDDGMRMKRSLNGGTSFTDHLVATRMDVWSSQESSRFPGTFRVPPLLYIDVDWNDGTLYGAYFDTTSVSGGNSNVDVYFTKSTDQGESWTTPVVVNGDGFPAGDQFFSWIEVDASSRLHLLYLDSRRIFRNDNDPNGMFDAYYAYSVNGGATWSEHRLTPSAWNSDNDGLNRPTQFIGDYLGMSVAGNRAYPVYLDASNGDTDIFTNVIELPVPGDVDGDGVVGFSDLVLVLSGWGPCQAPGGCEADLDGSGDVGFLDLTTVLANWSS